MSYCFSPLVIAVLVFSSADLKPKLMVQTWVQTWSKPVASGVCSTPPSNGSAILTQHFRGRLWCFISPQWSPMRRAGRALAIPWRRCAALPLRLRRPLGRWAAAGLAVAVVSRREMPDYRCSENSQAFSRSKNQDLIFFAAIG